MEGTRPSTAGLVACAVDTAPALALLRGARIQHVPQAVADEIEGEDRD